MENCPDKLNILITGAGGMGGSRLVEEVCALGHTVTGTINSNIPAGFSRLEKEGKLTTIKADLLNLDAVTKLFQERPFDQIFHLAGHGNDNGHGARVFDENARMGCNLLEAVRELPYSPRLILASSIVVYGPNSSGIPFTEMPWQDLPEPHFECRQANCPRKHEYYRASKYLLEREFLSNPQLDVVIALSSQNTSEGRKPGTSDYQAVDQAMDLLAGLRDYGEFINTDAEIALFDARDNARGLLIAAEKGAKGDIINIGPDEPITIKQMWQTTLKIAGFDDKQIEQIPLLSRIKKPSFARYSNSKLKSLGWQPRYTYEDALRGLWNGFKRSPVVAA